MDEKTIKKLLGLRIRQLRKKLKLTQFALGEAIDIDQRQIAYIEGGNSFPSLRTLNKLATVFNCSIKDLFDYEHLEQNIDIKEKLSEKISKLDSQKMTICYHIMNVLENNLG